MTTKPGQHIIPLRIVVRDPVPGVALRLQSGRFDLVPPVSADQQSAVFEFPVRVALPDHEGAVGFFGPFTQGPPQVRFVYLNTGSLAGQLESCWSRRAKIPLTGIGADLVRGLLAAPGSVLEVSIAGRGRDGTPVCASVKLAPDAWQLRPPPS